MVVGTLKISFHLSENHSLKEKRRIAKSLSSKIRSKFNVSVAEIGANEKWQVLELGIVTVGNDKQFVDTSISSVLNYIDSMYIAPILSTDVEILNI
jgi:uncharacterized protein YlxP (DUF503 family)